MSHLINAAKAAEMLGISKRKVYDLAQDGKLQCYRIDSCIRFAPQDIEEYRASCRSATTKGISAGALNSTATLRVRGSGLAASCALYATAGSIGKTTVRTPQKVRFMRSGGQKSPHTFHAGHGISPHYFSLCQGVGCALAGDSCGVGEVKRLRQFSRSFVSPAGQFALSKKSSKNAGCMARLPASQSCHPRRVQ